jgi:hypothetical protein
MVTVDLLLGFVAKAPLTQCELSLSTQMKVTLVTKQYDVFFVTWFPASRRCSSEAIGEFTDSFTFSIVCPDNVKFIDSQQTGTSECAIFHLLGRKEYLP